MTHPTPNTFALTLKLGNEAMQTAADIADALRRAASWLEEYAAIEDGESVSLLDQNGNYVGKWEVSA